MHARTSQLIVSRRVISRDSTCEPRGRFWAYSKAKSTTIAGRAARVLSQKAHVPTPWPKRSAPPCPQTHPFC
jgi:hypothetical protein